MTPTHTMPDVGAMMNEHEIALTVNRLRDIAKEYGQTQQLRERIAAVVVPLLSASKSAAPKVQLTPREISALKDLKSLLTHRHFAVRCAVDEAWPIIERLAASPAAPSADAQDERGACGPFKCEAAQQDGVLCSNDECDIASGVRAAPQSPSHPTDAAAPAQSGEPVQDEKEWAEGICQSRHEQDAWWKPYAAAADAVSKSADVWQGFGIQDARVCVDAYLSAKGSRDE